MSDRIDMDKDTKILAILAPKSERISGPYGDRHTRYIYVLAESANKYFLLKFPRYFVENWKEETIRERLLSVPTEYLVGGDISEGVVDLGGLSEEGMTKAMKSFVIFAQL